MRCELCIKVLQTKHNIQYDHGFDNATRYAYFIIKKLILDTARILFQLNIKINLLSLYIKNEYLKEYLLINVYT